MTNPFAPRQVSEGRAAALRKPGFEVDDGLPSKYPMITAVLDRPAVSLFFAGSGRTIPMTKPVVGTFVGVKENLQRPWQRPQKFRVEQDIGHRIDHPSPAHVP